MHRRSSGPASSARLFIWAVAGLFALLAIVGVGLSHAEGDAAGKTTDYPAVDTSSTAIEPEPGTALSALGHLRVKGRAPKTGYERDQFGAGWSDTNHNSCRTREDVLRRDLQPVTVLVGTDGCEVLSGTLADPYTGQTIQFTRGEHSDDVQIDHR